MVWFMPNDATSISMQPKVPINDMALRDLCLKTSLRFHFVPNFSLFHTAVFSSSTRRICLGVYGRSVSAAVPLRRSLTEM